MNVIKGKETHIIRTKKVLCFAYSGKSLEKTRFCHPHQMKNEQFMPVFLFLLMFFVCLLGNWFSVENQYANCSVK